MDSAANFWPLIRTGRMKTAGLFIFTLLTTAFALAGVFQPESKWPKSEVRVCFLDRPEQSQLTVFGTPGNRADGFPVIPFQSTEMDLIKKVVQEEYTPEKTGIHFVGWKFCSEDRDFDVILIRIGPDDHKSRRYAGLSTIGTLKYDDTNKSYERMDGKLPAIAFLEPERFVIAHEFGHLAGLHHEEVNPVSDEDPACIQQFGDGFVWQKKENWKKRRLRTSPQSADIKILTRYDVKSIMNVCHGYSEKNRNELLSTLDQESLRAQYVH